jgi:hypothetical protein
MRLLSVFLAPVLGAVFIASPAGAFTECQSPLLKMFAGDGGSIYLYFPGGGAAIIAASDPNKQAATAIAMTALASGREVIVRYAATGVSCSTVRSDFEGLWML